MPAMRAAASSSAVDRKFGSRHTTAAAAATTSDMIAKTAQLPTVVITSAAVAGPTRPASAKSRPANTFAALSSSGLSTTPGVNTDCAGRVVVTAVAATIAASNAAAFQ